MNIPAELLQARADKETAWSKFFDLVEKTKDASIVNQAYLVCEILDQRAHDMYHAWQALGGTSDIESLALRKTEIIARTHDEVRFVVYGGDVLEVAV